jgi:phosphoribosylformylglycinamidine synthase
LVLLVGNDTGRDGMLGSSFASRELGSGVDVSAIQVGNPLMEKLIIDAVMDLVDHGIPRAIKDVGGGGLATALSELAAQFGLGIEVNLDSIRLRDAEMSPGEILVSESQERMIIVVEPPDLGNALLILRKYGVGHDLLGRLISDRRFLVFRGGEKVVDLPIDLVVNAEEERHAYSEARLSSESPVPPVRLSDAVRIMLRSPVVAMKDSIIEAYDHEVGVRTVIKPGRAGAAVLRLLEVDGGDGKLGIAIKADSNPRYSRLDPFIGAANSLAKAYRNVVSVGARPIVAVDSVNVGNPGKPDRYWQFARSIEGLAWMGGELGIPFVGGKVSFYNEDESTGSSIDPVVAVAVLGIVDDIDEVVEGGLVEDAWLVVVGTTEPELGGSEYMSWVHGVIQGTPPAPRPLDELRNAHAVLGTIKGGLVVGSMDVGVGGLLTTLMKMALIGQCGFDLDLSRVPRRGSMDEVAIAFSESNARYVLVTHDPEPLSKLLDGAGVDYSVVGSCGGDEVRVRWGGEVKVRLGLGELEELRLRGVP